MVKIKALTFKEKHMALRQVFSLYRRAKLKLKCIEETSYYPQIQYGIIKEKHTRYNKSVMEKLNEKIDDENELREIIVAFECIIDTLSEDSKFLLVKEYIENAPADWWIEGYSKSTYYRLKTRAMEEFLFYLNV